MNTSLQKIIAKDFDFPDHLDDSTLRLTLVKAFDYLLTEDFSKLLQILYRADVDQEKLKALLAENTEQSAAEVIADAYIARQQAKVAIWEKYSKKGCDEK